MVSTEAGFSGPKAAAQIAQEAQCVPRARWPDLCFLVNDTAIWFAESQLHTNCGRYALPHHVGTPAVPLRLTLLLLGGTADTKPSTLDKTVSKRSSPDITFFCATSSLRVRTFEGTCPTTFYIMEVLCQCENHCKRHVPRLSLN